LVADLESRVDARHGPIDDILELAQLYIEPCHREGDAIALFEAVLERDPQNSVARLWISHCCLHYLMESKALRRAAALLASIISTDSDSAGAAYWLLAQVLDDLGELSVERRIELLEASVACEPAWVLNRQSLASAYEEAGDLPAAIAQIRQALANVGREDPSWRPARKNFERSITGRASFRIAERLHAQLARLSGGKEK
jgi:thioredoxin-like negative regulator of GroEL